MTLVLPATFKHVFQHMRLLGTFLQQVENSSTFTRQNLYMLPVLPAQGKLVLQHSYVIPMYGVIPALFYQIRSPHSRDLQPGT